MLLTGAGGAGTIEIIRTLKRDGWVVIGADAVEWSAGLALADERFLIPWAVHPTFPAALREMIRQSKPRFVVPLVDEEIPIAHAVCAEFPGVQVVAPTPAFCTLALDKWAMAESLARHGLPTAPSWLASEAADAVYPAIVKPRTGRGSRGLAFLDGPDDLARYLAAATDPADRYIVQRRIDGREFTSSAVVALEGPLLAVVPKEATVKKGITQVGVTREMPAIDAVLRRMHKVLDPRGPFNVQQIVGDDGVPYVIEVNPRYSTTVALTLASGVDEVGLVMRHALGLPVEVPAFQRDLMMIRHTGQVFLPESAYAPVRVP
ncbi:MAG: ATP-grasp domain-containing protein [Deltaproteobacteria bacterium]|nr:ATP-grasp domain-containing protein [Deltaproteobacteria bacterium]